MLKKENDAAKIMIQSDTIYNEDRNIKALNGIPLLILNIVAEIALVYAFIRVVSYLAQFETVGFLEIASLVVIILLFIASLVNFAGFKSVKPNEAVVFTLFGKYYGVIKKAGFHYVNPFLESVKYMKPLSEEEQAAANVESKITGMKKKFSTTSKLSLKTRTLMNRKQKINDEHGNPIEISIAVVWKIRCATMAVLNVENFTEYLSIQTDSVLRNIVRSYPYDVSEDEDEKTLRASSNEISDRLAKEIQEKVGIAGIEILEARIIDLAYATEIAAAMLQRQQASAMVDARQLIVEGAVGMVDMALKRLSGEDIIELDDERKAQMVSNLMVVLCGNKDAQPIINSGSLY